MNVTIALRVPAALAALTLLLFLLVRSADTRAEEKDGAIVTPLLSKDLVGISGKEVAMVRVGTFIATLSIVPPVATSFIFRVPRQWTR